GLLSDPTAYDIWLGGDPKNPVPHNLKSGDLIVYNVSPGGTPIGGLVPGRGYFVIKDGPYAIQLADTHDKAVGTSNTPVTPIHLAPPPTDDATVHNVTPVGNLPIPGLQDGSTYVITGLSGNTFQLTDKSGHVIDIEKTVQVTTGDGTN